MLGNTSWEKSRIHTCWQTCLSQRGKNTKQFLKSSLFVGIDHRLRTFHGEQEYKSVFVMLVGYYFLFGGRRQELCEWFRYRIGVKHKENESLLP